MKADLSALESVRLWERFDSSSMQWVICTLDASSVSDGVAPRVYISSMGDTGLTDMVTHLKDDQIQFGVVRVYGVDPRGGVVSKRTKHVFFQWVGPTSKRSIRAHLADIKGPVSQYFRGHHVALELFDREDINEKDLEARLRACGGAHSPDHFEFASGSTVHTYSPETAPSDADFGGEAAPASTSAVAPIDATASSAASAAPTCAADASPIVDVQAAAAAPVGTI